MMPSLKLLHPVLKTEFNQLTLKSFYCIHKTKVNHIFTKFIYIFSLIEIFCDIVSISSHLLTIKHLTNHRAESGLLHNRTKQNHRSEHIVL